MTAINVIKQSAAVHMLTDGACWLPSGRFGPPCIKSWPLPYLNCVIAARGPRCAPALIADYVGSAAVSYDDFKSRAAGIILEATKFYQNVFSLNERFGGRTEYVVAGWSELAGPDAFVVSGDQHSLKVSDSGPVMMAPGSADMETAVWASLAPTISGPDDLDPVRDGLAMLNAQRNSRTLSSDTADAIVGAFAHLTTVTRNSISSRIVHRWEEDR